MAKQEMAKKEIIVNNARLNIGRWDGTLTTTTTTTS